MAEALLDAGADPRATTASGQTVYHLLATFRPSRSARSDLTARFEAAACPISPTSRGGHRASCARGVHRSGARAAIYRPSPPALASRIMSSRRTRARDAGSGHRSALGESSRIGCRSAAICGDTSSPGRSRATTPTRTARRSSLPSPLHIQTAPGSAAIVAGTRCTGTACSKRCGSISMSTATPCPHCCGRTRPICSITSSCATPIPRPWRRSGPIACPSDPCRSTPLHARPHHPEAAGHVAVPRAAHADRTPSRPSICTHRPCGRSR